MSVSERLDAIRVCGQGSTKRSNHGKDIHTNHCSKGFSGFGSLALSRLHQAHTAYTKDSDT